MIPAGLAMAVALLAAHGAGRPVAAPYGEIAHPGLVLAGPPHPAAAPQPEGPDRWIAEDKLRHLTMSFALTALGNGFGRTVFRRQAAFTAAGAAAFVAGIGKEVHDRRAGRRFSLKDLTWDAAGVALGLTLSHQLN